MAILSNGLLGSSRKKIGNIVTYRMKGQDIARSKPAQVANPRTASQQTHRVKLANLVNIYKANRPWMERLAFESKPAKWSVYNAFVSANLTGSQVYLTKEQADRGDAIVSPYKVSAGSLPPIVILEDTSAVGSYASNLYIGQVNPKTATVAEVSSALLENNNGLEQGMQISLIVNYQSQTSGRFIVTVRYFEVIIDTSDTTLFADRISETHIANVGGSLGFVTGANDPVLGFTYILSQDVAGKTRVSTQNLVLNDNDLYNSFGDAAQLSAARASYGASTALFLAGGYQGSSADDVALAPSILSAKIGNDTVVNAGDYLGGIGTEDPFTMIVNLSSAAGSIPKAMAFETETESASTTSISGVGTVIAGDFDGAIANPTHPIKRVLLTLANGSIITADFALNKGLAPEGDVTE